MSVDPNALNQIARFDDQYQPAERQQRHPGLEALTDNQEYDFTIQSAEIALTPEKKEPIFRMILRVDKGSLPHIGLTVETVRFFNSADASGYLGADLITLGFDADKWTKANNRSFSAELAAAIPKLAGIRFAAKKVSKQGDKGVFHNLYINRRLGHATSLPAAPPNNRLPAQPIAAGPAPTGPGATPDDDVPF